MHLAYYDRAQRNLTDHEWANLTQYEVRSIACLMAVDVEHDQEENPPLFVAWDDGGPSEWIGVFSLDGEEVEQPTLDRIEQLAKGLHLLIVASVRLAS
jgi:hypothetical protein